jgi:hypothetical protein
MNSERLLGLELTTPGVDPAVVFAELAKRKRRPA